MQEYLFTLEPGKKFKVALFILPNKNSFFKFLTKFVPHIKYDQECVACFLEFDKPQKNWIGGICLNKQETSIPQLVHELDHVVFAYLKYLKIFDFQNNKNQERFAYIQQNLLDQILKKIKTIKRYDEEDFSETFKYVSKKLEF